MLNMTVTDKESQQYMKLIQRVKQITKKVAAQDATAGTLRPEGVSLGRSYESLGIHLVAMYLEKISGATALRLIAQVAEETENIDAATLLSMISVQEEPDAILAPEADA